VKAAEIYGKYTYKFW